MKSIRVINLLSNKRVWSFQCVREEEIARLMEKIGKSGNKVVNLSGIFMTFTNDVIYRVAFGRRYSGQQDGTHQL